MQMRRRWAWASIVGVAALLAAAALAPAAKRDVDAEWRARVEADWRSQDELRGVALPALTTANDALGAVDGRIDGRWGFHTGLDTDPWWQVDLGSKTSIDRVVIWNRCDAAGAAARVIVSVSLDGKTWREAYRHDGTVFLGHADGKPLAVSLGGAGARFVRLGVPGQTYLYFDEVQVFATANPALNIALGRPADQSSLSQWSYAKQPVGKRAAGALGRVVNRGRRLAADLIAQGVDVRSDLRDLEAAAALPDSDDALTRAHWAVRRLAFRNPLLDFDRILFVKRPPGTFSHMSDQNYGWWSRPGGGLYVAEGWKTGAPRVRALTPTLAGGSVLGPDLSYDARKVLFAYCRYYPHVSGLADKLRKENLPEDAFYHVYEVNIDGTGMRQITHGRYDDFDPRYLPDGRIAFLSTRRGAAVQCTPGESATTLAADLPDSYVRCGGDATRPVAVYTLHTMLPSGKDLRAISPFENFEWTPSVADDGRLMYARWDYVDRNNMPYMSLWTTNPDGTVPQAIFGNFTKNPHCIFEARSIPNSRKVIFTASAHHSITGGSLVLLDPSHGVDGPEAMTRLTPEVSFPESEGWPNNYYLNPFPLSEQYFLTAWSNLALGPQSGVNPANACGVYLYDAFGNLEMITRDTAISSMYPIPVRPRRKPPVVSTTVAWAEQEGRVALMDVYQGLRGVKRGSVKSIRVVAVPAKTQPWMHSPELGITRDDPGKCVIGTAPVEADGSAFFRAPSGVPLFFQALDDQGHAIQTMRSATYLQPHQTMSCGGCHEPRSGSQPNARAKALSRPPSRLTPGPEGSWPLRFDKLVQPVLDRRCVSCHKPAGQPGAARPDLTPARSYDSLIDYGAPSLRTHVQTRYNEGRSLVGAGASATSPLLAMLRTAAGHHGVTLDRSELDRLTTWMDTYAQRQGHYSQEQEEALRKLRTRLSGMLQD